MSLHSRVTLSIRSAVIAFFGIFFTIIGIYLFVVQYKSNKELAIDSTNNLFFNLSNQVAFQLNSYEQRSYNSIELIENLYENEDFSQLQDKKVILKSLTKHIEHNPYIYSLYLGSSEGEFYQVINLKLLTEAKGLEYLEGVNKWLIVNIDQFQNKTEYYLNQELEITKKKVLRTSYNPAIRPWFENAMESQTISKTQPYEFTSLEALGITFSKKLNENLVIGLDISLNSLKDILKSLPLVKGSELFLFNKHGQLIANNLYSLTMQNEYNYINQFYSKMFFSEKEAINTTQLVKLRGEEYLQYYQKLSQNPDSDYLVILSPKSVIMEPYNQKIIKNILIYIGIFIGLSALLLIYSFKVFVEPIKKVASSLSSIEDKEFEEVKHIPTFISELDNISLSINSLVYSIQDTQKSYNRLLVNMTQTRDYQSSTVNNLTDIFSKEEIELALEKTGEDK